MIPEPTAEDLKLSGEGQYLVGAEGPCQYAHDEWARSRNTWIRRAVAAEREITEAYDTIFSRVPELKDANGNELSVAGKIQILVEQADTAERERDDLRRQLDEATERLRVIDPPTPIPANEALAAKYRAEILSGDGKPEGTAEGLARCAVMLDTYGADCFPANDKGQIHFARAMMQSTADEIRAYLAAHPKEPTT